MHKRTNIGAVIESVAENDVIKGPIETVDGEAKVGHDETPSLSDYFRASVQVAHPLIVLAVRADEQQPLTWRDHKAKECE
jgi:hypothetical protein